MIDETKLKARSPFAFTKNWKVGFLLFFLFVLSAVIYGIFSLSENSEVSNKNLIKVIIQGSVFLIFIIFSFYFFAIKIDTRLIINETGIKQRYAGSLPFGDKGFFYSWQSIKEIKINKFQECVEIQMRNGKKLKIGFYVWEVDKSSIDLEVKDIPNGTIQRANFDKNGVAILKAINYWKPIKLFPGDIKAKTKAKKVVFLQKSTYKDYIMLGVVALVSLAIYYYVNY